MVVFGGVGSLVGAVMGSLVMGYLNLEMDAFQELPVLGGLLEGFSTRFMSSAGLPSFGWVVTGTLIVLTIVLEPKGLYGLWVRLAAAIDRRRAAVATAGGAAGPRQGAS